MIDELVSTVLARDAAAKPVAYAPPTGRRRSSDLTFKMPDLTKLDPASGDVTSHDASTNGLINHYKTRKAAASVTAS